MSLEPPRNANQAPPDVLARGRRVFDREECSVCRAPPAYTTGQLTLAQGWKPAANHPNRNDVMMPSVGTDPGTALTTRKGTGFYTIPTLRGLWYHERLLHDGSLAILEELFDPARLAPDFELRGWNPPGQSRRAVHGHIFGSRLDADDRAALIAFLRSL